MPNRRKLLLAAGLSSCALPCVQAARQPKQPHVVVIGAGGAGLAAAAEAARCGALVTVLEKQNAVGGDTLISGGFYAAVDPKRQIPQGISDSIERFTADILESGGDKSDPRLAQILARGAGAMLEQLESLGMRFQPDVIEIYGAHWPRCHKPMMPNGVGYIQALHSEALRRGAQIRTNCQVTGLILNPAGNVSASDTHLTRRFIRCAPTPSSSPRAGLEPIQRWLLGTNPNSPC